MSTCRKCARPLQDNEPRWMFTPDLPLKARFDKCQECGAWTHAEQAVATHMVASAIARGATGNQVTPGCNCTGKR